MNNQTQNFKDGLNNGKHEAEKVLSQAEKTAGNLADVTANKVESAFARAKSTFASANTSAKKMGEEVESYVKRNPILAVSAVLGTGLLIGRMFAPSRKVKDRS